jgi:hypothetical protein
MLTPIPGTRLSQISQYWISSIIVLVEKHTDLLANSVTLVSYLVYSSNLKMEAAWSSDKSVNFKRITRYYIPQDRTLHNPHCELTFYTYLS